MVPPTWAFQVENFDPPPHEELICSICQCVFCEPVECPCRHVFCTKCIDKWIGMHRNCPICRKRTSSSSFQPVNRIIKNLIMGLTLKCKNVILGCEEKITLEAATGHLKICPYELEECPNSCGKVFFRREMSQHNLEECPLRRIKCDTCGLNIEASSSDHNCVEALQHVLRETEKENSNLREQVEKLQKELDAKRELNTVESSGANNDYDWSSCSFHSDTSLEIGQGALSEIFSSSSSSTSSLFTLHVTHESSDPEESTAENSVTAASNPNSSASHSSYEELSGADTSLPHFFSDPSTSSGSVATNPHTTTKRLRLETSSTPKFFLDKPYFMMPMIYSPTADRESNVSLGSISPLDRAPLGQMHLLDEPEESTPTVPPPSGENDAVASDVEPHSDNGAAFTSVFRRTLNLLRQHVEDSDPEWLPEHSNESSSSNSQSSLPATFQDLLDSDSDDSFMRNSTSSPARQSPENEDGMGADVNEDSQSSYEVQVPTPTFDLLQRYCNDTDSDPDWTP